MNTLKTDYVDAVFSGSRKYAMTTNSDSTVSFTDQTTYTTEGDRFGSADINETNGAINKIIGVVTMEINQYAWTQYTNQQTGDVVYYRDWVTSNFEPTDSPIVSLYIPFDTGRDTAKIMQKNFSYINDITIRRDTVNNRNFIRVIVNARPTDKFYIMFKGV